MENRAIAPFYLLASVADRRRSLEGFFSSLLSYSSGPGILVWQREAPGDAPPPLPPGWHSIDLPRRIGPHAARVAGLALCPEQPVIVVDDDMRLTAETNFSPALLRATQRGVGLVSCGWRRSETAPWRCVDIFKRQAIVYTGGGLVVSVAARPFIAALPLAPYWCDNTEWSLACYRAGLVNYRYRGSCSIHAVCGSGGRKRWISSVVPRLPSPAYLSLRPSGRSGEYGCIPADRDLTPLARQEHWRHRADWD